MGKTTKTKKPQAQRPKGPGAKQEPRRASTRVRKQAPTATELAAPAAPRCGQEDCKVCNPQACNNCKGCQRAAQKGFDLAKNCEVAKTQREKPCPAFAEPPRDDGTDPRTLDEEGPHFKASTEILGVMDALADDPTKLEPSNLYALACFKDSLDKSGRLNARWASLDKIKARDDYDVDDINANQSYQKAIEAAVRSVHFQGGSKPSVEEMGKMGSLEMRTVVRVLSYIASMQMRTKAQMKGRPAVGASLSDQARDTFVAIVEGLPWNGRDVCTSLARRKKEPWPKYWRRSLDLLTKNKVNLKGARRRFYELLKSVRNGAAIWVCRAEMRAWFLERECQYQRMMASTTDHW